MKKIFGMFWIGVFLLLAACKSAPALQMTAESTIPTLTVVTADIPKSPSQTPTLTLTSSPPTEIPPTVTPFPPTETVTPIPSPTASQLPHFAPSECLFQEPSGYDVECGFLIVPEDRENPNGRRVSLHVAIFRSTNQEAEPDPVIYLMGGGGGNALNASGYYLSTVGDRILESRDFIMYNQRGTYYNDPFLECPGEITFTKEINSQELTQQEKDAVRQEFILDCRDNLLDQGIDLSMYNSVSNAADANDLRIALGYEQVNFYGTSYGTRLGLTIMRYYPEGIRSMILDSVFPPQINYPSDSITSMVYAVDRLFQACAADEDCSSEYPNLEDSFYQTIDNLREEPGSIPIEDQTIIVDEYMFLDSIYLALHYASVIPDIPNAIDHASHGRFGPLKWAIETIIGYSANVATGVYYSSFCRDEVGFDSIANAESLLAIYPPQYTNYFNLTSYFHICDSWGAGQADPIENKPVVSDISTLIFAGHFDPITSPEWSRLGSEKLSHHYFYEFLNMGHGVMRSDKCALEIGLDFLQDPHTEPESTCMDQISLPDF